ncbi:MAG: DUF1330 domain-containing protein [Bacteroidota bacterium]
MHTYLDPRPESVAALLRQRSDGPVVMLNLLRFRPTADYTAYPDLAPPTAVSGREAYEQYLEHTRPFLAKYGGEVIFRGHGEAFLIGPDADAWEAVLLVRYPHVGAFLRLARDAAYLAGAGHRTAALADSRLLPLDEVNIPAA